MRDLALLTILVCLCWLALLRPWLGVVGLALLSAMHPQSYGGEMLFRLPMYILLFLATCLAVIVDSCIWHRGLPAAPDTPGLPERRPGLEASGSVWWMSEFFTVADFV